MTVPGEEDGWGREGRGGEGNNLARVVCVYVIGQRCNQFNDSLMWC